MSLFSGHGHLLANLGAAAPIHAAAAFTPGSMGRDPLRMLLSPVGLYTSYRAGKDMDKKQMSEGDALFNAGLLANSVAHLAEPLATKPGSWNMRLAEKMYKRPNKSPRNLFMAGTTLGLTLPLYFYYRQGLKKKEESVDAHSDANGVR